MGFYDIKKIEKELNRLNIPRKYRNIPLSELFSNNYSMVISVRENAGKTTEGLLIGVVIKYLYNITTEYLRSDDVQIRRKSIENLYGTIRKCGYISKIFRDRWNDVDYKSQQRKFYLIKRDEDGNIIDRDTEPLCAIHSNEAWSELKSGYNSPNSLYIFYDEIFDTNRGTMNQWEEFMNNISTIGRPDSRRDSDGSSLCHVLMTGNNSNLFSPWFDDFCISDKIKELRFGHSFKFKTELGSSMFVKLLDPDDTLKKRTREGMIDFFGFNTKKAAQFIGLTEWSGKTFPHLEFDLNEKTTRKVYDRLFVRHRDRLIQIELYADPKFREIGFCHFASEPYRDDNIILTLQPVKKCEVYGIGEYENNKRIYDLIRHAWRLKNENRFRYASNFVGEILDDYEKNL